MRDLDQIDWSHFTGRRAPSSLRDSGLRRVAGKRILITGAGGYIGSALARTLATLAPQELILLDIAELGLYQLDLDLRESAPPTTSRLVVGSVCDAPLIDELFDQHRPHIVFHAAACKHVPLMESNPFAAASTNILGTSCILEACDRFATDRFILLSTDKAVEPVGIMGATKRVAEQITLASTGPTRKLALRLGNVLGSSGSVVPLFLRAIAEGLPLPVTHPNATRYFLSIEEAVHHLLSTLDFECPSAVLVPTMNQPHRIHDLATFLITLMHGSNPIIFTGLRPGDKLTEHLHSCDETLISPALNGLHTIRSLCPPLPMSRLEQVRTAVAQRNHHDLLQALQIPVPELREFSQVKVNKQLIGTA